MKSSFCPLLFLLPRLYPEDLIHILLHGPVVDHLSAKGLIRGFVGSLQRDFLGRNLNTLTCGVSPHPTPQQAQTDLGGFDPLCAVDPRQ